MAEDGALAAWAFESLTLADHAQIDVLLNPCAAMEPSFLSGYLQLLKMSKTQKLVKIARIMKIARVGKCFTLLKKIEERFVMVRLTAFKAVSILVGTFIIAHIFGCIFVAFATFDENTLYTKSWVHRNGSLAQY